MKSQLDGVCGQSFIMGYGLILKGNQKERNMKNLETTIIIQAPVSTVWNILVDLDQYAVWNPFIVKSEGVLQVGNTLKNTMQPEGKAPMVFKPKVLQVEENKAFRWIGRLLMPGLFDGEHYFKLESIDEDSTRLIHGENFKGILVSLIWKQIGESTKQGFIAMNEALKARAEKVTAGKLP